MGYKNVVIKGDLSFQDEDYSFSATHYFTQDFRAKDAETGFRLIKITKEKEKLYDSNKSK